MTGYIAVCQLALVAVALLSCMEVRRWDIFWYIQRFLWAGGFLAMFYGLLSEYVNLFRLEQQRSRELAEATAELKKSEEDLRRSEATLRTAIEATGLGTFDFDPRSGRLVWSDRAKQHFGLSPSAPTDYTVFQSALHPEDRERVKGLLQQALDPASGGIYDAEYRTIGIEDGQERWLVARGHVFFDDNGAAVRVVGATLDMTERKRAESRLRRIFESGMIGIFYWRSDGVILDANRRFLEMIGRSHAELEAGTLSWPELTPPGYEGQDQHALEEMKEGGVSTPYEKEFFRGDGTRVSVLMGGAVLEDNPSEGVAYVLDITERKQAETTLRVSEERARDLLEMRVQERTEDLTRALHDLEAETRERIQAVEELRANERVLMHQSRLAAMGEMLVNISHQWRQPLNMLNLLLQTVTRSYERGTFTRELLEKNFSRATEIIEHMSGTIDDFSKYLSPDRVVSPFNLRETVEKTLSMVAETLRGIEVDVQADDDPSVTGYRNEYAQVLINILTNARDALQEKGVATPQIWIRIFPEKGKTVVTITDNAGDIAPEVMERIFEPYFTTKPGKGTGIGLFMSKNIIEKSMAGSLTVRNTDDGAEFRIEV